LLDGCETLSWMEVLWRQRLLIDTLHTDDGVELLLLVIHEGDNAVL
jgi:hypothetical protein